MEVLDSDDVHPRRRVGSTPALAVALALLVLAVPQALTVLRSQGLPADVSVQALPNGYSFGTDGADAVIGFQLRNDGERPLRVRAIGAEIPGLQAVDVVVSGEPVQFEAVGAGMEPLPEFDFPMGTVVEVSLVYRARRCSEVPREDRPLQVTVRTGRAEGVLAVQLPGLPSDALDAGPDDQDPWQQVLVRDLCA